MFNLQHIAENISGIWGNKKFELHLGLNYVFVFEEKESGEIMDGFYQILQIPKYEYPTLRLTELNGTIHDYLINDLLCFETLTISREGKKIHFKNVPPDEYDGEVINPANN